MAAAVDVNAVLQAVYPASASGLASGTRQEFLDSLNSRQIVMYDGARRAGDCANAGRISTPTAVKIATNPLVNTAIAAIPLIGPIIDGILGVFGKVFGIFGGAHAAAVAKEQGTLCTVVPQVNQALLQVDADFAAGNLSIAEANSELDQIKSSYLSATSAIYQSSGSKCNAACVVGDMLDGEVLIRKQAYQGSLPASYYLKHYWWVGAIVVIIFLLVGRD